MPILGHLARRHATLRASYSLPSSVPSLLALKRSAIEDGRHVN